VNRTKPENPYQSNIAVDSKSRDRTNVGLLVAIGCIAFTVILVASHWFFLGNPNHRIGGVAWNALFQIFGNLFGGFTAVVVIAISFFGKISKPINIPLALILGSTSIYCFFQSFGILLSV
jgi:hypothetical protein